jgi:hypothetical protein
MFIVTPACGRDEKRKRGFAAKIFAVKAKEPATLKIARKALKIISETDPAL